MEEYLIASQTFHLKLMRDIGGKRSGPLLRVDPDGRMRTSYNIGGTIQGAFS